jgi:threonyl-tRNA synthetase
LHGFDTCGFTQDDAYFVLRTTGRRVSKVLIWLLYVFGSLGFENFIEISLRDKENREKYIGSDENWKKAENAIINAAKKKLDTVIEHGKPLSTDLS